MEPKYWLEIAVAIIALFSFFGGIIAWHSGSVQKKYAAQRDFEHLKRNYQQLAENQKQILDEIDEAKDSLTSEIKDIKGMLMAMLTRISPENSIGWRKYED